LVKIDLRGFLTANVPVSEIFSGVKMIPRLLGVMTFVREKIETCKKILYRPIFFIEVCAMVPVSTKLQPFPFFVFIIIVVLFDDLPQAACLKIYL
jgi:hypothetical protein